MDNKSKVKSRPKSIEITQAFGTLRKAPCGIYQSLINKITFIQGLYTPNLNK